MESSYFYYMFAIIILFIKWSEIWFVKTSAMINWILFWHPEILFLQKKPRSTTGELQRCMSMTNLESLFCYDKSVPEETIDTPVGLSLKEKDIGNNPSCTYCRCKGAVLCATCSGCGLYVDSILESQGVIVKVRCLGKWSYYNSWIHQCYSSLMISMLNCSTLFTRLLEFSWTASLYFYLIVGCGGTGNIMCSECGGRGHVWV